MFIFHRKSHFYVNILFPYNLKIENSFLNVCLYSNNNIAVKSKNLQNTRSGK